MRLGSAAAEGVSGMLAAEGGIGYMPPCWYTYEPLFSVVDCCCVWPLLEGEDIIDEFGGAPLGA